MGDSTNSVTRFERSESTKEGQNSSTLLGDSLVCKSPNDVFRLPNSGEAACHLPSAKDLLAQLSESPKLVCEAPKHEQRGKLDVSVDDNGQMVEVTDHKGTTYTKRADGKWDEHYDGGSFKSDNVVENVKVDSKGNLSYDYNDDKRDVHVHTEKNADGSYSYTNNFGKFTYDPDGRMVEAPAGNGHNRKFHYTDGQVDQIDGVLGHWDRVVTNGEVSWKNKDSGAVWQGDFTVDAVNNLVEWRGKNGAAWDFTAWGTDIQRPNHALTKMQEAEAEVKKDAEAKEAAAKKAK